jgi:hypothetical protein
MHKLPYALVLCFCLLIGINQIAPEPIEGFAFNFVHALLVVL